MKRKREHGQVEMAVGCVDCGGVHLPDRRPRVIAEVTCLDRRDGLRLDVGHRHRGPRMPFEQLAGQPAVARAELEDLGVGHVGHLIEHNACEPLGVAEEFAHPIQRPDDAALDLVVDVVAVEVLQAIGLQQPIDAGGIGAAAGHSVKVGNRLSHVGHHGRLGTPGGQEALGALPSQAGGPPARRAGGRPGMSPLGGSGSLAEFVAAIDQGTTSTRCMIFDHDGAEVGRHQLEHEQILPKAGWVEHNPVEITERTASVMTSALNKTKLSANDIAALGITNQRETSLVWNKNTGRPYYNAIVRQDTRTDRIASALDRDGRGDIIRQKAGLPPATYFSGGKVQWILENVDGVRADAERGDALFGTPDTWVLWNLTGGPRGGVHVTDVTNASRTMLMNLETLDWDDELLGFFDIPRAMLPDIRPSADSAGYGEIEQPHLLVGVRPTGVLGDQHAAMVGQVCFAPGEAKNTYGTGNFLLLNTGRDLVRSKHGLLTTVCYQFDAESPAYALEGSIAVTGSAVQWLRDQLGIIAGAADVEELARRVDDNGGMYFVPAFSGLFAPYWRSDARGAIVGLSRFNTNAHLARATLEAICYQSRDVAEAMEQDSGVTLEVLKVDGGVTANELCMQIQADVLGVPVSRPVVAETTALGAAYAAGLAVGFWASTDELRANWHASRRWSPTWTAAQRRDGYAGWRKAVERTLDWVDVDEG